MLREIIIVIVVFQIVNLNSFIFELYLLFYLSCFINFINRLPLIVSIHFFSSFCYLLPLLLILYWLLVCRDAPLRCEALCYIFFCFGCTDVQKMFNSVNEYNLSEKQLSGCQSMIAWFSDVNELDTKKIMCYTHI